MGGEWDSTNVGDGQVAVFTPIALDHTKRLGDTVAEIARTKSGIIKPAADVVTSAQPPEALAELERAAELDRVDRSPLEPRRVRRRVHRASPSAASSSTLRGRAATLRRPLPAAATATTRRRTPPSRSPRSRPSSAGARSRSTPRLARGGLRHGDLARAAAADRRSSRPSSSTRRTTRTGAATLAAGARPVLRLRRARLRGRRARRQGRARHRPRARARRDASSSSRSRARTARCDADELGDARARGGRRRGDHRLRRRSSGALEAAREWAAEAPRRAVVVTGSIVAGRRCDGDRRRAATGRRRLVNGWPATRARRPRARRPRSAPSASCSARSCSASSSSSSSSGRSCSSG